MDPMKAYNAFDCADELYRVDSTDSGPMRV